MDDGEQSTTWSLRSEILKGNKGRLTLVGL